MRKVVFGGANSLDNYFARKDDTIDWLMWSDEVGKIMAGYFKTFDTIVMGRRTYEVSIANGYGLRKAPQQIRSGKPMAKPKPKPNSSVRQTRSRFLRRKTG